MAPERGTSHPALSDDTDDGSLVRLMVERFASLGGVEMDLPSRDQRLAAAIRYVASDDVDLHTRLAR